MLAYYYIQHGASDTKSTLSAPLTYTDMLSGKLLDRGINPQDVGSNRPVKTQAPSVPVKVYGGSSTPQMEDLANLWAKRKARPHIQKKTGASDSAMDFWFQGE